MIVVDHRVGHWVFERIGGKYNEAEGIAFGRISNCRLIGGVCFDSFNGNSIAMHCAGEGNWLSRELLFEAFYYPFEFLKVKKIIGPVSSVNTRAQKLDENLGFVLEATIKDAARYGDLLIYTMTKDQCRFLGVKYGRRQRVEQSAASA